MAVLAQDVNLQSNSEEGELLHVENTSNTTDKTAVNIISNTTYGVGLYAAGGMYGIRAVTTQNGDGGVFGITSEVYNTSTYYNFGALLNVDGGAGSTNSGVYINSMGGEGSANTAIYGNAYGASGSINVGVFGTADGAYSSNNWAGYFDGNVMVTGDCECYPSDEQFKKNVNGIQGGLSKVMALKPKSYEMKTEEFKDKIHLGKGLQFGLLAQDVQTVLPELVHDVVAPTRNRPEDLPKRGEKWVKPVKQQPFKFKALNYTGLIPVMLEAMQEQQGIIDSMRTEIAALKAGK
jgi:hypothetical protein